MLFDVYGRNHVYVDDERVAWLVDRDGKRGRLDDLVIPSDADGDEITDLLDIAFHELARPGEKVIRVK